MNNLNSSFQSKQMVLVSLFSRMDWEYNINYCTLIEIDELRTSVFQFPSYLKLRGGVLADRHIARLINKKQLKFEKHGGDGWTNHSDIFSFSIVTVFVADGQILVNAEDLFGKGCLVLKTEAHHIIRIKKTDNALATESKSSD